MELFCCEIFQTCRRPTTILPAFVTYSKRRNLKTRPLRPKTSFVPYWSWVKTIECLQLKLSTTLGCWRNFPGQFRDHLIDVGDKCQLPQNHNQKQHNFWIGLNFRKELYSRKERLHKVVARMRWQKCTNMAKALTRFKNVSEWSQIWSIQCRIFHNQPAKCIVHTELG